jgi:hypothetical protein
LVKDAIPAAIEHLAQKRIFGDHPLNFGNVFRQMYNVTIQAAFLNFLFHRALVLNGDNFLQFHGTMLKSWVLLRVNELLSKNLLVTGSRGYLKDSIIGKAVIDSFILPVFDGHYTINTFISQKYAERYLNATERMDPDLRIQVLRRELFLEQNRDEINANPANLRHPKFFNFAQYIYDCQLPFDIQPAKVIERVRSVLQEIRERNLTSTPEYRYKVGDLIHWMESVLAAVEFWKVMEEESYLNVVIQQFNGLINTVNTIISEGGLSTDFLTPLRQFPLPQVENAREYLLRLLDVQGLIREKEHWLLEPVAQTL